MPIEPRDILPFDEFWTFGLASVSIGAITEAKFVHLGDHFLHAVGGLDLALGQQSQMADFCPHKQHGASILASRHTGATTDTRSRIHSHVCFMFWNRDGVGIGDTARGGADVASRLDDFVEGGAVHHEVADDRESLSAPRLNPDVIAILELAHVELAGGNAIVIAVRPTINIKPTHATDALATVVIEANGMGYAVIDKPLIQDVEHLKERAIGRDVIQRIGLKMALGSGVLLTPNM